MHETLLIQGTSEYHQIAVPNEATVLPPKQASLAIEDGFRSDENQVFRHTATDLEDVTLYVCGPMQYAIQQWLFEAVIKIEMLDGDRD